MRFAHRNLHALLVCWLWLLTGLCDQFSDSNFIQPTFSARSDAIILNADDTHSDAMRLPYRAIDQWSLSDFLLIGTIDGSLYARDRKTGRQLWYIQGESPLVKVSILESLEQNLNPQSGREDDDSNITWIVEPLGDGSLYYFLPSVGLQKLPVSIKQLVLESPFMINGDDKIYTGTRSTTLYSINASTGEIIRVYGGGNRGALGHAECRSVGIDDDMDYGEDDEDYRAWKNEGMFMIGRTDYHLEIHNKTEIIWNVTFSTWGPNNMDIDLATQHLKSPDNLYVTPLHENSILALSANATGKPAMWAGAVQSIATHIFDVFTSQVGTNQHLLLLPQPQYPLDAGDSSIGTYVDRTSDGQWFALSGDNFPSLVRRAPSASWHPGIKLAGRDSFYKSLVGVHAPRSNGYPASHITSAIQNGNLPALPYPSSNNALQLSDKKNKELAQYYGNAISSPSPPKTSQIPPVIASTPYGTWAQFIIRLVENVLSILVIVILVVVGARMGWLPQIIEFLESALYVATNGKSGQKKAKKEIDSSISGTDEKNETAEEAVEKAKEKGTEKRKSVINGEPTEISDQTSINDQNSNNEEDSDEQNGKSNNEKHVSIVSEKPVSGENTGIKKRKRGSRGGKRGRNKSLANINGSADQNADESRDDDEDEDVKVVPIASNADLILQDGVPHSSGLQASPLTVTEETLGYGSQGTVVFKGFFENREVAVKRMLLNFYDLASQEVTVLQESDDHPNVVRYFCKHQSDQFLYIALELCPGTLEDVIERPDKFMDLVDRMDPVQVLYQIASGLCHLHSLKIVHRDIKPQNILVAPPKKLHKKGPKNEKKEAYGPVRLLISDFGLCKRLEGDQSSFRPTTAQPAGTAGWTPPEISMGSRYPEETPPISTDLLMEWSNNNRRLTRAVDIFSLGCVFYYVLSRGNHPFGVNSKRESNIEENNFSLDELSDLTEPGNPEATDLIEKMISFNPRHRPDAGKVLLHPFFWSPQKKLHFLLKFSDRFETDTRAEHSDLLELFEQNAIDVVGKNWHTRLDKAFIESLNKYRKYHGNRMIDLLRAMRNKSHHFNDLPPAVQQTMGPVPDGFLHYFTRRFPHLLMTVYYFASKHLSHEAAFQTYFEEE